MLKTKAAGAKPWAGSFSNGTALVSCCFCFKPLPPARLLVLLALRITPSFEYAPVMCLRRITPLFREWCFGSEPARPLQPLVVVGGRLTNQRRQKEGGICTNGVGGLWMSAHTDGISRLLPRSSYTLWFNETLGASCFYSRRLVAYCDPLPRAPREPADSASGC